MKPHVICHMMSPLDGRLAVSQWSGNAAEDERVAEYGRVQDELDAQAWLVGRVTMEEFAKGKPHEPADPGSPPRPHHFAKRDAAMYGIGLDPSGKLHFDSADVDGAHPVVLLGRGVPDSHLAELVADGVSYVVSDSPEIDLAATLDLLGRELGIRRLLLEGGGATNGRFLRAGLVDEISLLLFPAIDGHSGGAAIFEAGPDGVGADLKLTLTACDAQANGVVRLRYQVG